VEGEIVEKDHIESVALKAGPSTDTKFDSDDPTSEQHTQDVKGPETKEQFPLGGGKKGRWK